MSSPVSSASAVNLLVVLGPTATGKTRLAVELAYRLNGEIISADSRQVYRGLNIGAGKDLDEYTLNGTPVPYHLIDIADLHTDEYSIFAYRKDFSAAFSAILQRNRLPVLAGGSGMYLSAVLEDYRMQQVNFTSARAAELMDQPIEHLQHLLTCLNPALHNTTDLLDRERIVRAIIVAETGAEDADTLPKPIPFIIGVAPPRELVRAGITRRLHERLHSGMIEEVQGLLAQGIPPAKLEFLGLEYRFILKHLQGELTLPEMTDKLNTAIHQFAKRQMTWFRRMEKHGVTIHWLASPDPAAAMQLLRQHEIGVHS